MCSIRIALLQMTAHGTDLAANLVKGEAFCRRAAAMGADVALFPEMWNIGYTPCPSDAEGRAAWHVLALTQQSEYVTHFRGLAHELDMTIALTYLERRGEALRNSVSLIDRRGEILFTYSKVHPCEFDWEAELEPGDDFYVATLDAKAGPVQVGAMICFDREFPESARVLMLKGAEIILTPNACELEANRIGQFRARAMENMIGVAMANYAAPQANGHSVAFSPVCFDANERSLDPLVIEAGEAEGVYLAEFDLDKIRAWREHEAWGNAFRKPRRYSVLTSLEVEPPFIRAEARR
jgi:N-carbamoylputrescine amidase